MSNETAPGRDWARAGTAIPARRRPLPLRLTVPDVAASLEAERDRLFLWSPVAFGAGIAAYFAVPAEPSATAAAVFCILAGALAWRSGTERVAGLLILGLFLASAGFLDAAVRSRLVAAPIVEAGTRAASVEGRIVSIDRREDGSARILVEPRDIDGTQEGLPRRLSLSMRGAWPLAPPGTAVRFRAVLMPPPAAALPGGFDYARQAWFEEIGGVGFLVSAPETVAERTTPGRLAQLADTVERLRLDMSARIEAAVPGPAGAIAAALVTGQRGAIPEEAEVALRASGLAHILAISGLHMMLVVGTLFWCVRAALALSPALALGRPIKKWSALVALAGAVAYLVLSGASIATQRAFIMAAIMLVAVLLDRPAITMRNVALAALVVLFLTPEALIAASFQMSFAATVALVAGYEALRGRAAGRADGQGSRVLRAAAKAVLGLVLTALIAGLATGPASAFHFNRIAVFGLIANVAAMPVVSLVVMPMGLLAAVLMPFGLEGAPLTAMGLGVEAVLAVAGRVAGWEGAVRAVPQMPVPAFVTVMAGGLWLTLWGTRLRLLGLPVIGAGLLLGLNTPVPDVFVARDASVAALRTRDGLVFLPRQASGYVSDLWVRSIGSTAPPVSATASGIAACDEQGCIAESDRLRLAYVIEPSAFEEDCAWADVVVTQLDPPGWCETAAVVIGPRQSEALGAVTIRWTDEGPHVTSASEQAGQRPWARGGG